MIVLITVAGYFEYPVLKYLTLEELNSLVKDYIFDLFNVINLLSKNLPFLNNMQLYPKKPAVTKETPMIVKNENL